jgi:hypothetical protein
MLRHSTYTRKRAENNKNNTNNNCVPERLKRANRIENDEFFKGNSKQQEEAQTIRTL